MPRLIPQEPRFADDGGAERRVWEALRDQLPDEAVLLHGRRILEGPREHEVDLVVLWPEVGLALIEVKGGHVDVVDGAWTQSGRDGVRHPIDPVGQVQRARHALTDLIRAAGLDGAARARTAHLVALPFRDVPREWSTAETPRGTLLGRKDLDEAAHHVKRAVEQHGGGLAPLLGRDVDAVVDVLARSMPSQLSALTFAAEHETHADQMTEDQARLIDLLANHRRFQVVGGAGTGKTFLALTQARRRAKEGERVALLCYSRGLARYLQRVVATWRSHERPAYVGLFHDLPVQWGAPPGDDARPEDWEERLPQALGELAAAQPPAELFDAVVVDEAQDFGDLWWPALLRCLRDPVAGGLYVFLDESQRVFDRDGVVPITEPPFELKENLRSTKQIAQLFGAFGDRPVHPKGFSGEQVNLVDVPAEEAVHAADRVLDLLLDAGWEPGQIALLTTHHRHPLQVEVVAGHGHAAYWDTFLAADEPFYGHVLGFKGLERSVVVLAVNGFRDEARARRLLYTGMSRARSLLVVVGPREEIERIGGAAVRSRLRDALVRVLGPEDDDEPDEAGPRDPARTPV